MAIHVLLVEDDHIMREMYRDYFESHPSVAVHIVDHGKQALQALETTTVDVIVTDLTMPHMDGPTFLEAIRKSGDTTPALVVTGHADALSKDAESDLGIHAVIQKPFDLAELAGHIEAAAR